jgi:tRNA(fMet)-specific endonuclease VapC
MNLRVLDTDHISLILRGDRRIIDRLQSLDKSKWAVTIISIQEVFNGWVVKLNDPRFKDQQVALYTRFWNSHAFFQQAQVLNFDSAAESCYDRLLATYPHLSKRRIEKDVKIAAIALANQGTIVTRNQRDFMLVPGLELENWAIDVLEQ